MHAQDPFIEWDNTVGGTGLDGMFSCTEGANGGYLLAGYSYSNISGDKTEDDIGQGDCWFIKLNADGVVEWDETIGGTGSDTALVVRGTSDGGFVVAAWSNSDISADKTEDSFASSDFWIFKIDGLGAIEWQNTIGGTSNDQPWSIEETTDGGYIVGGFSSSDISGDKIEDSIGEEDYWVLKLDALGVIEWQNTIGGTARDELRFAVQTMDGGYFIGGESRSPISGDKTEEGVGCDPGVPCTIDYWVLKLDENGVIDWQNTIGGEDQDNLADGIQTADGGFLLSGHSNSDATGDKTEDQIGGVFDLWIVKLDAVGEVLWDNTIGGTGSEDLGLSDTSISQTTDGGFLLGGFSDSNISGDKTENGIGGGDLWILKLNNLGIIEWQNTIGGNTSDFFTTAFQTSDGGFLIGSSSYSGISGDKTENPIGGQDYWVVKHAALLGVLENDSLSNFSILPNPVNSRLQINYQFESLDQLTIYSNTGSIVEQLKGVMANQPIDVSRLSAGLYYVQVKIGNRIATKKFIKQ